MPKLSVAPLQDPLVTIEVLGETHPAIPQLANGTLLIPVINDGDVAVTGGQATLTARGEARHQDLGRLGPNEVGVLLFGRWEAMPSFELVLHGNGTDGRSVTTSARFDGKLDRYL